MSKFENESHSNFLEWLFCLGKPQINRFCLSIVLKSVNLWQSFAEGNHFSLWLKQKSHLLYEDGCIEILVKFYIRSIARAKNVTLKGSTSEQ